MVGAAEEQTILEAARDAGISIPTLCHLGGLSPIGACRLCVVEITSSPKLFPACVTKVAEGMDVRTNTERLQKYRRMILELLFAERNHVCSVCVSISPGAIPNPARRAANVSRPAPPAPSSIKARPSPKWNATAPASNISSLPGRKNNGSFKICYRLVGRMFRLPHVIYGPRRVARRSGRKSRPRL